MLALLLALAAPVPAIEATERAFAALAARDGEWSAFRAYMAPDAFVLDPELKLAAPTLAAKPSDPIVQLTWYPATTVTACDGSLAVSTGPWRRGPDHGGRFFTVWERQPDTRWKWIFEGRIEETAVDPLEGETKASRTACRHLPVAAPDPAAEAGGISSDGTLRWLLTRALDRDKHRLLVEQTDGRGWTTVVDATVS